MLILWLLGCCWVVAMTSNSCLGVLLLRCCWVVLGRCQDWSKYRTENWHQILVLIKLLPFISVLLLCIQIYIMLMLIQIQFTFRNYITFLPECTTLMVILWENKCSKIVLDKTAWWTLKTYNFAEMFSLPQAL